MHATVEGGSTIRWSGHAASKNLTKYPDVEQEREMSKRHLSKRELESFFATGIGGTTRRPV